MDEDDYKALRDSHLAAIPRSRSAAGTVQRVAGGLSGVYAATLGFTLGDQSLVGLSGLLPVVFLALAMTGSSIYLSFLGGRPRDGGGVQDSGGSSPNYSARLASVEEQVRGLVLRRVFWLRLSVASLAVGVLYLPVPFIDPGTDPTTRLEAVDAAILGRRFPTSIEVRPKWSSTQRSPK